MFRDARMSGARPEAAGVGLLTLDELDVDLDAQVKALRLEEAELDWVRAVGIFEGERLLVLRRAAFGGPLHVRTRSGGEFALDRRLAAKIVVEKAG